MGIKESEYSNYKFLLTEAPMNPFVNKKIMASILFEKFDVPAFNIEPQAKLSLLSEARDSGIVLDSGDGVTHCIPIYNNVILHHYIKRLNIAGRHITEYLVRLLQRKYTFYNICLEAMPSILQLISKLLVILKKSSAS